MDYKVIKLDKRYKNYHKHGHTIGLKFINWYPQKTRDIENFLRKSYGDCYIRYPYWDSYIGTKYSYDHRGHPYYVTLRDESMLMMLTLAVL
jgi:hypothetical protein